MSREDPEFSDRNRVSGHAEWVQFSELPTGSGGKSFMLAAVRPSISAVEVGWSVCHRRGILTPRLPSGDLDLPEGTKYEYGFNTTPLDASYNSSLSLNYRADGMTS